MLAIPAGLSDFTNHDRRDGFEANLIVGVVLTLLYRLVGSQC